MFIEFSAITIQGFGSFNKPVRVKLAGSKPGLVFIKGRNVSQPSLGANDCGKSTMFKALTWVLFGACLGSLRNPDIEPWSGTEKTKVTLEFKIDDTKHVLVRTANPNRILLDDELIGQPDIEQMIRMSFRVFTHTVLWGQGEPLFFDLAPRDKMELFVETLDLERWDRRSKAARDRHVKYENELTQLQADLNAGERQIDELTKLKANVTKDSDDWASKHKESKANAAKALKELRSKLELVRKNHAEFSLKFDSNETELKAIRNELETNRREVDAAGRAVDAQLGLLDQARRAKTEIERELKRLGSADTCPVCNQSIKGTSLAEHKRELKSKIVKLDKEIKAGVPHEHTERLARAEAALKRCYDALGSFTEKSDDYDSKLRYYSEEKTRMETQLHVLETSQREAADAINPHRQTINDIRDRIRKLEERLDRIEDTIRTVQLDIEDAKFWTKAFKEIRLFQIDEVLQELELVTNALLPEYGLDKWQVRYLVESQTKSGVVHRGLDVVVLGPNNTKPVKWQVWGGGVGQRLRLVGSLSLAEVLLSHAGVNPNLEILDEPTKSLSIEGVQDMCEYLAIRADQLDKDILLVDHTSVESVHFSKVLTVVKGLDGFSHVEAAVG